MSAHSEIWKDILVAIALILLGLIAIAPWWLGLFYLLGLLP